VAPVVAAVGDGHTALWPPAPAHEIPWDLEVRADGLWVRGWGGHDGPPLPAGGARIASIEGLPAEDVLSALSARYGGETPGFVRWRLGVEAWRALPLAVEAMAGPVDAVWRLRLAPDGADQEVLVTEASPPIDPRRGWLNLWLVDPSVPTAWPPPGRPGARVEAVLPGGAAARAGLRGGDLLVAIDGAPVADLAAAHDRLVAVRRGRPVSLTVAREDGERTLRARAGRWRPWTESWTFAWSEDALVVDLDAFHDPAGFAGALDRALAARPVGRVVVDLRGNDGGDAQMPELLCARLCRTAPAGMEMIWRHSREAHRDQRRQWGVLGPFADLLAPRGTFLGDRPGGWWAWAPPPAPLGDDRFPGPVDVLVDGGTFSASVYAAAILRDHAGARLVGEPPGSGPVFHAHALTAALPETRLRLQVATATFRVRGTRDAPLVPDVPVPSRAALAAALGR
jgi:hypothetical protein